MTAETSPQQVIFDEFRRAAAPGWVRGEIEYRRVGKTGEASIRAYDVDDNVSYPDLGGLSFRRAMRSLRSSMAQPGSGTWFTASIVLTPEGGFSMEADYDNEPAWKVPVVALTYAEEQELFPRDEANQPEWYKAEVARGVRTGLVALPAAGGTEPVGFDVISLQSQGARREGVTSGSGRP